MRRRRILIALSNTNGKKKRSFLNIFSFLKKDKKTKNQEKDKKGKNNSQDKNINTPQTFDSLNNQKNDNNNKNKNTNTKNKSKMKIVIIVVGVAFFAYAMYSLSPILFGSSEKTTQIPQIPQYKPQPPKQTKNTNNNDNTNKNNTGNNNTNENPPASSASNNTSKSNAQNNSDVSKLDAQKLFQKRCDLFANNNRIELGLNNQIYIDDNMYSLKDTLNFSTLSPNPVSIDGYKFVNPDTVALTLDDGKHTCQIAVNAFKNFEIIPYFEAVTIKEKNSNKSVDYMVGDTFSFGMKIKAIKYPNVIISTPAGDKIIKKVKQ